MTDQMITHQFAAAAAAAAQVPGFSSNIAHGSLSIITIQQAQDT